MSNWDGFKATSHASCHQIMYLQINVGVVGYFPAK